MDIFKFGGASVKDASGVKNVLQVLKKTGVDDKLIVVSAMGKMTNAFELVISEYLQTGNIPGDSLNYIKDYHYQLSEELFGASEGDSFY